MIQARRAGDAASRANYQRAGISGFVYRKHNSAADIPIIVKCRERPFRDRQRRFLHLTTRATIGPEVRGWIECGSVDHNNIAPSSCCELMRNLRRMREFVFAKGSAHAIV